MTDCRTHPEYLALLAAVLASPADDLPRLVYADWLEEHGQPERAEFVRVQCELAKVPPEPDMKCSAMMFNSHIAARQHSETCEWCRWVGEHRDPSAPLRRRERELWVVVNGAIADSCPGTNQVFNTVPEFGTTAGVFDVRRGFVAEVHCTLADWCGGGVCRTCRGRGHSLHEDINGDYYTCPTCRGTGEGTAGTATVGIGPRLVREHPVERVVLTDREPYENAAGKFLWMRDTLGLLRAERAVVPRDLWSELQGYNEFEYRRIGVKWWETRDDALAALIAWAKDQPAPA